MSCREEKLQIHRMIELAKRVFNSDDTLKLAEEYQRKYGRLTPRDNCFLRV